MYIYNVVYIHVHVLYIIILRYFDLHYQENERKSKTIDHHLEDISQKAKEVKELQKELSQNEIERRKGIDKVKEKEKLIADLQESLHKQTDQTAEFEQKWIAAILEMEKDGAVVNEKQRRIEQLTVELQLAQTIVS